MKLREPLLKFWRNGTGRVLLGIFGVVGAFVGLIGLLFMTLSHNPSPQVVSLTRATPSKPIEARYYKRLKGETVQCELCFRMCIIPEGERGFCRTRENRGGTLYTLVYNRPCALHVEPIEKEPMLHFLPGKDILCIGTASCNFRCRHCHNWHMSQRSVEETHNYWITPSEVVELAIRPGCVGISFTYNEPIVFFEYMFDIVKLAKERGLKTIFHTNGSLNPEPLRDILKYVDGVTVDLKGFTEEFYSNISSARLSPVLNTLKIIKEEGVWLEIVNLIIPTLNDEPEDIRRMCEWIRDTLGKDTPLHFSRFFPAYKLTGLPPTPIKTLELAHKIAKEVGLEYATIGNVPGHTYNSTFCPKCGKRIIHRIHFEVLENRIKGGRCKYCGHKIPGIWG